MPNAIVLYFKTDRDATMRRAFPRNIGTYVDESVARFAGRVLWRSIDGANEELTYREFQKQTLKCAVGLQALGVRRGAHVALMLPNVPAYFIAGVALTRLGTVAVAVNAATTSHELHAVLQISNGSHLLIGSAFLDIYRGMAGRNQPPRGSVIVHGAPTPDFPGNWRGLLDGEVIPPGASDIDADEVASIQFTAGSSGLPKSCMLSHLYWLMIGRARASAGPPPSLSVIPPP